MPYIFTADLYCDDCMPTVVALAEPSGGRRNDLLTRVAIDRDETIEPPSAKGAGMWRWIFDSPSVEDTLREFADVLGIDYEDERSYDSSEFPKNTTGLSDEADSPQHCDHCHIMLENSLTDVGVECVGEAVAEGFTNGHQNPVTAQWIDHYADELGDDITILGDEIHVGDMLTLYQLLPLDRAWVDTDRADLRVQARRAGWI